MSALYIHIPFCLSKCGYCAFYSKVAMSEDEVFLFLSRLKEEAKQRILFGCNDFDTVFIGGGNPTALGLRGIEKVFEIISEHIDLNKVKEFTIETNPETLSNEIIEFLAKIKNIRISMGVQRLSNDELKILGRNAIMDSVHRALDKVFEKIRNVSCDFILGVPGCNTIANSLSVFVERYPLKHISAYFLGVEEDTPLYDAVAAKEIADPEEIGPYELFDVKQVLADSGYNHYEISNYAKPGYECRHNLNYWLAGNYLGLGPSAVSFNDCSRLSNVSDLGGWLNASNPDFEKLSKTDLRNEYIMLHLRLLLLGLNIEELEKKFGSQDTEFYETLNRHINQGFIELNGSVMKLSAKALAFADSIISDYFCL